MRRKMLGAILLPVPFAALPIVVVLAGALFGGSNAGKGELVTRQDQTPPIEQRVATHAELTDPGTTLARTTAQTAIDDCGGDIFAEF